MFKKNCLQDSKVYGFEMARLSEVYLSTVSSIMKPHGLERAFVPMIFLCKNSGKVTQRDLGLALKKDKVATKRTVDYLEKKGLLHRNMDEHDKRCHILVVTDKAIKLLPLINAAIQQTNDLFFKDFSEKEVKNFKSSMNKLYDLIGTLPEPKFIVKAVKRKTN